MHIDQFLFEYCYAYLVSVLLLMPTVLVDRGADSGRRQSRAE